MLQDFKPVLKILLRFILIYVGLVLAYQFYLNEFKNSGLDPISTWVAEQAGWVQNTCNYQTELIEGKPTQETTWFLMEGKYVSRMVEGCNAVSVMVLFIAFIFAFYQGIKTFVFAGLGLLFLHIMNVSRIVGLNFVFLKYPEYGKISHNFFFPVIIYGSVVVLWLIWIKFFALKTPDHEGS
ncbi:exosortase family protein XrtF [Chryseobacterium sp. R2A-55]|uniref:exosortase family protein XrtF n=1 Tax=Chryseobacterium sp. R2A-55 TaxID=2744445 RepID=UPI001F20D652|nr:exosortase family protein XrtF [Chryseobacterium sp. R2A-55]